MLIGLTQPSSDANADGGGSRGGSINGHRLSSFMKLKCTPKDFQVEELTVGQAVCARGATTFYRLTKRGLGTIEAVEAVCRRWNLSSHRISYGGLKDRHARDNPVPDDPGRTRPPPARDQLRARAARTLASSRTAPSTSGATGSSL